MGTDNRRIAKNTLMLYIRMLLMIFVSFYTSRVILNQLGVSDYGVYNVVAGVVSMMTFLNSSMSAASQRFFAYDMGQENYSALQKTFSMSINIHFIVGLIVIILGETVGLWFVIKELNVPSESRFAALVIYQLALAQTFIGIVLVPHTALIVAAEKMSVYAYISLAEAILKLVAAFLLIWISFNKLVLYGILNFCMYLPIVAFWIIYSSRSFPECRYKLLWDKNLFSQLFSFAGWQTLGSTVLLIRTQGINIIINLFFGPILNTARGLAVTINNTMLGFVGNVQFASNPQITKTYAAGELLSMHNLLIRSSRICFMLMIILAVPIICETEFILKIWLKEIPPYSIIFVKLIMIATMSDLISGTLVYGALSTGKIKAYQLVLSSIMLSEVIFTIIAYHFGFPAYSIYIIDICINVVALIGRLTFVKKLIDFPISRYIREVITRDIIIAIGAIILSLTVTHYLPSSDVYSFAGIIISVLITTILVWFLGLDKQEKTWIKSRIIGKLHRG